jgi:hypothetical protein
MKSSTYAMDSSSALVNLSAPLRHRELSLHYGASHTLVAAMYQPTPCEKCWKVVALD